MVLDGTQPLPPPGNLTVGNQKWPYPRCKLSTNVGFPISMLDYRSVSACWFDHPQQYQGFQDRSICR